MAEIVPFGGTCIDRSTALGFQFEFLCPRCGTGYMSRSMAVSAFGAGAGGFAAEKAAKHIPFVGDFVGHVASDAIGDRAKEAAQQQATSEIMPAFARCPHCGLWRCRNNCWNAQAGLCLTCAPLYGTSTPQSAAQPLQTPQLPHAQGMYPPYPAYPINPGQPNPYWAYPPAPGYPVPQAPGPSFAGGPVYQSAVPGGPLPYPYPTYQPAKNRRRWYQSGWVSIGLPVLTIILALALIGGIALHSAGSRGTISEQASSGPVVLPAISAATFASVGTGSIPNPIQRVSPGVPVLRDSSGKPVFLFVGAEYCPYCAAERWSLVVALDRFGSFTNLHASSSSDVDVYPDTPTFTFHGSLYSSPYLTFESVELQDRNQKPLETLTPAQLALMQRYDTAGSIPFLDIGNQYLQIGSGYSVAVLANQSWNSIANQLDNPSSLITQNIVANANYIAAAICRLANNQPVSVCSAAPIPKIEGTIGKLGGQLVHREA